MYKYTRKNVNISKRIEIERYARARLSLLYFNTQLYIKIHDTDHTVRRGLLETAESRGRGWRGRPHVQWQQPIAPGG